MGNRSQTKDNVLDGAFRIPHDRPPKALLMLTAYLDESGQEQDDWMFIAGFMGDDAAWEKFVPLWKKAIGPQRTHLHMKDLRFTRISTQNLLAKAGPVPKQCGLIPILASIRFSDYSDLLTMEKDKRIHSAYIMCCKAAAVFAMRRTPKNDRVEIVLERQDRYGCIAEQEFHRLSKTKELSELLMEDGETSKLANWRFVNKEDTVMCEPGDYFAYAMLQQARNKNSVKAQWTRPIWTAYGNEGVGAALLRRTARGILLGHKKREVLDNIAEIKRFFANEEGKRLAGHVYEDEEKARVEAKAKEYAATLKELTGSFLHPYREWESDRERLKK
jgi:hypothetical protein